MAVDVEGITPGLGSSVEQVALPFDATESSQMTIWTTHNVVKNNVIQLSCSPLVLFLLRNPLGQFCWQPPQHWMGFTKLVRYPFRRWVQGFVVYNTISVCRRHRPIWIWSEPCRLEQMHVNVLPTPSTPAHCLPSQCTAQDQQNRPGASNIAYDIVYDVVYDIIRYIVHDIAYDVVYDIAYDIVCDVLDKLSIAFYVCVCTYDQSLVIFTSRENGL
jgi:hypothetical protein